MADARGELVTTWWVGLRQHAHDSRPAYALSALCAMSMPFGFGQAIKMAGNEAAKKAPRLIPPFWQMLGFSVFFGTGAYMIDHGDTLNGSGVISAWSLTYVTFHTLPKLRWLYRSPLSLLLSTAVTGMGLGVYANYYFDKSSWRGAVPGLLPQPRQEADKEWVSIAQAVATSGGVARVKVSRKCRASRKRPCAMASSVHRLTLRTRW